MQHAFEHFEPAQGLVVAFDVVAVAEVAAANQDSIGAPGQRVEDELRVHPGPSTSAG